MKGFKIFLAVSFIVLFIKSTAISAYAYPEALPIPDTSEMEANEAIIEVALSQIGYTQDPSDNNTVYAEWAGKSGSAWCSEFVAWCAYQAGIPLSIIPIGKSSQQYINFYNPRGQFVDLTVPENNKYIDNLKKGDILLIDTNKNKIDGPEHTCLYILTDSNGIIHTIDGNAGGKVKCKTYNANQVYGICKPDYEKVTVRFAGLTQDAQDTKVVLSWHSIPNATKYRVQRLNDSVWTTIAYPLSPLFTDKNLINERLYKYRVLAFIDDKWSEPSNIIQATPLSKVPKNVIATAGEQQVRLTWDAVTGAEKYRVQRLDNSLWRTISIQPQCYYVDKNLETNKIYEYRILSLVNEAWSSVSATVYAKPRPVTIQSPKITEIRAGTNKIGIKWNSVTNSTKYQVKRRIGSTSNWLVVYVGTKTSYIDQQLSTGQTYYYCVCSYVNGKWSNNSNIVYSIPLS